MDLDIDINDNARFIPKANGNDQEDKPITFVHRYLTVAEQSEIEYYSTSYLVNRIRINVDYPSIFKRCVSAIENFTIKGKPISKPEEFLAINGPGCPKWLNAMMKEVADHIYDSAKVDEKN